MEEGRLHLGDAVVEVGQHRAEFGTANTECRAEKSIETGTDRETSVDEVRFLAR